MKNHLISAEHEKIVAHAISPVASELRLIDLGDLIAMLRYERMGCLSDLVTSAAELYFLPDIIQLGEGGDYVANWGDEPKIVLNLEIKPENVTIYAQLILENRSCGVEVNHIAFDTPVPDVDMQSEYLRHALEMSALHARISPSSLGIAMSE